MKVENVFVSVNAADFIGTSHCYARLLERTWDREPIPACLEWDLAGSVLFQVLDNPEGAGSATLILRIEDLDRKIEQLRVNEIDVPSPDPVEGFDTLRFCQFSDPEGITVGLLEGA